MKDRLSQEDLEKLKHWVEKRRLCKSPHCGEKCIIEPERKEKNDEKFNNTNDFNVNS
jgi:hypothetical protein